MNLKEVSEKEEMDRKPTEEELKKLAIALMSFERAFEKKKEKKDG